MIVGSAQLGTIQAQLGGGALSGAVVVVGPGDEVTTAPAYFRRTVTSANAGFGRTDTTRPGYFRRTVTTEDAER